MSSPSKRKGTAYESVVVAYLNTHGFPEAERRALSGSKDKGDIAGVCSTAIETKACKTLDLAGWVDEAIAEAANAGAQFHLVVAKRRMKPVEKSYAVMELGQWVELARSYLDLLREVELHRGRAS
jgi:Holliday junction resolvase